MMPSPVAPDQRFHIYAIVFVVVYFSFEACFVSAVSVGAGLDDAELISNLSFWNWGYGGSQPPLYTWIAYGITRLFGLHFALLQVLKFSVLASTFLAVYAGLRQLEVRPAVAACAMLSVFLLPQISWESQRALIHSVMGTAGSAWCFAAFAWFVKKRSVLSAVIFGLTIAAAILGKYNGGLFVLALLLAALLTDKTRPLLKTWLLPLSLLVAGAAMAPALLFMILHPEGVMERSGKFNAGLSGQPVWDRLTGLFDLSLAALYFLLVAAAMAALILWFGRRGQINGRTRARTAPVWQERFLAAIVVSGLMLVVLIVAVSGATHIKDRWLQPVLLLAPASLALLLARADSSLRACKAFGIAGVVAALLVPGALYINLRGGLNRQHPPIQMLDYAALARTLHAQGPVATVFSTHPYIPGNLRLLAPALKTLFVETPFASRRLSRPLVVLWDEGPSMPVRLHHILQQAGIKTANQPMQTQVLYKQGGAGPAGHISKNIYYLYIP